MVDSRVTVGVRSTVRVQNVDHGSCMHALTHVGNDVCIPCKAFPTSSLSRVSPSSEPANPRTLPHHALPSTSRLIDHMTSWFDERAEL